ncbi:MAG: hypothetical protein WDZ52_08350 [Pseudohongiellaceae bacterium]
MEKLLVSLSMLAIMAAASPSIAKSDKNAKNSNSQAGGLPALAAEVAELRSLVESLQGQIGSGEDSYAGTYAVTLVEQSNFGCGLTTDPATVLGTPAGLGYFQNQAISSATTSSSVFTASSDGMMLSMPDYVLVRQELRLSGSYEEELRVEGDFDSAIGADGSLFFDPGPESEFYGQMSADGSMFTILARGRFVDGGCEDSYTVSLIGVRK